MSTSTQMSQTTTKNNLIRPTARKIWRQIAAVLALTATLAPPPTLADHLPPLSTFTLIPMDDLLIPIKTPFHPPGTAHYADFVSNTPNFPNCDAGTATANDRRVAVKDPATHEFTRSATGSRRRQDRVTCQW